MKRAEIKKLIDEIESANSELLNKGRKTDYSALAYGICLNYWILGVIICVIKAVLFGWTVIPWSRDISNYPILCFIIETVGIFIMSWVLLYIISKPIELAIRFINKQQMSPEEYKKYKYLRSQISELYRKMPSSEEPLNLYHDDCLSDMSGDESWDSAMDVSDM